jgi:plasmid stabilization system protein ParE
MRARFVLSPEAAQDIIQIWRYIRDESSVETAERVESAIREKIVFLTKNPRAGHLRTDLTNENVRFFPVYSYLIVYRPETKPLQVVAVLHGHRDVRSELKARS